MKKHSMLLSISFVVLSLFSTLPIAFASLPHLMPFQGRLSDISGNPVNDTTHGVTFRIFNVPSGGTALWTEATTVNTSGGLFTHQLGSVSSLPHLLFQDNDSLFLEITADGQTISPRTRLGTVPYSRVAAGLEIQDDNSDTITLKTFQNGRISIYEDFDGQERVRLQSETGGELQLYDGIVPSNKTVDLDANSSFGGTLELRQEDATSGVVLRGGNTVNGATLSMRNRSGAQTIFLDTDTTGTSAVVLPSDAISRLEILDEPGVANVIVDYQYVICTDGVKVLASKSITVPTSGYIIAICSFNGGGEGCSQLTPPCACPDLSFAGRYGLSNAANIFQENQKFPVHSSSAGVHGFFTVSSGTSTIYFLAEADLGRLEFFDIQLTLIYFPTAYGTVTNTMTFEQNLKQRPSGLIPQDIASEQAEAKAFNQARIEKELAEIQAQRAALEERIKKLEEQITQQSEMEK